MLIRNQRIPELFFIETFKKVQIDVYFLFNIDFLSLAWKVVILSSLIIRKFLYLVYEKYIHWYLPEGSYVSHRTLEHGR